MTDARTEWIEPSSASEIEFSSAYRAVVDAGTVRWQGEIVPLRALWPAAQSPDRRTRERAWRLVAGRWLADRPRLQELWRSQVAARTELAVRAGTDDYPTWRRQALGYPPTAPRAKRQGRLAVEEFVTSVLVRLHERRRRQLGLRTIRPWDLLVAPPGFPVEPVLATEADALDAVHVALRRVKVDRGGAVAIPVVSPAPFSSDAEVEDALGRYGQALARPVTGDMERNQPEWDVATATAVTLLVLDGHLNGGDAGVQFANLARTRIRHLERVLLRWTFAAMMDAFEEWTYTNPSRVWDEGAAAAAWSGLWLRFLPAVDWAGLEDPLSVEWQRHEQLFLQPAEPMVHIAAELQVFEQWSRAAASAAGVRRDDEVRTLWSIDYEPTGELEEMDLLDVARWMEDAIEDLERMAG